MDIENGNNINGSNVWQYTNNGSDAQKWVIKQNNDGTYNIISKVDSMYLDISNDSTANGSNIQIFELDGSNAQKFKFIKISDKSEKSILDGNYRIALGYQNNIGLDVSNGSLDNQANVQLWEYTNALQQKFIIEYTEDNYYKIKNVRSDKVLDVEWGGMAAGTNVWQYEDNNSDSQKWIIEKTNDGYYNIISKLNGLCLDIVNGSTENGTNVLVNEKTSSNSQKFQFISTDSIIGKKTINDGIYRIAIALDTNSVIDIAGASTNNQANANIWQYKGQIQQKFKIEYDGTGYYKIKNVNSGKVLDVEWGGMTAGTNVWQYEDNG